MPIVRQWVPSVSSFIQLHSRTSHSRWKNSKWEDVTSYTKLLRIGKTATRAKLRSINSKRMKKKKKHAPKKRFVVLQKANPIDVSFEVREIRDDAKKPNRIIGISIQSIFLLYSIIAILTLTRYASNFQSIRICKSLQFSFQSRTDWFESHSYPRVNFLFLLKSRAKRWAVCFRQSRHYGMRSLTSAEYAVHFIKFF